MARQKSAIQTGTNIIAHILNTQKCQPFRRLQATSLLDLNIKIVLVIHTKMNKWIEAIFLPVNRAKTHYPVLPFRVYHIRLLSIPLSLVLTVGAREMRDLRLL
jgi:hypothetical protein